MIDPQRASWQKLFWSFAKTMYIKKLLKFNRSFGVIIPKPLADAVGLHLNDLMVFSLEGEDKMLVQQYDKWVKNKKGKPSKSV